MNGFEGLPDLRANGPQRRPERAFSFSDWLLCLSVMVGLVWAPALAGLILAALLRKPRYTLAWKRHHTFLLIAALLGMLVVFTRGIGSSTALVLRYGFLWVLPFIILLYRPDARTVSLFSKFVFGFFLVDFAFNVGGTVVGHDLLGRVTDLRDGVLGARMGGIFAHSFYSGSISLTAMTAVLAGRYPRVWAVLPAANLILAGSWRLSVAVPLILLFLFWKHRGYLKEMLVVGLLSVLVVLTTVYTSGLIPGNQKYVNDANTLRVFAWVTAIEKISSSPLIGVGYPKDNTLEGVDNYIIDDALTAESWYLGSAITFGIPYTLLRFAGLLLFFYSRRHTTFARISCPLILIDMVYGGFFDGTLFYTMLWIQLSATSAEKNWAVKARKSRLGNLAALRLSYQRTITASSVSHGPKA